ncbi:MAG: peptidoglycan DD-metalloendopeptidase family protein [Candidatus Sungbacteria bacterium]|uniref:Peptidoglycan DD-metalloendopeptidase family protein n=1 Tax=Candidatus Sungiibacteriota bacterium TaxID=2750080 RepID=A0A932DSD6_9BACT|nr:peptidoglycan DD-metalloendopeptidase family protein [Candidatus Sungbacteria bacterium]
MKKSKMLLVFLALAAAPLFAFADQLDDLRTEKAGLQSEIDVLEAKINEYQKELGNKREEINTLKNEITRINTQISKLNLEIKKTENQIYLTRINIQETQTDIHETELSIVEKREVLAGLLREFRKFDEETLLERALKYDTLTEVVKQTEYLDSLQLKLNEVLSATKTLKNNLENKEVVLKENKKELENKNAQLAVQKNAQQSEKTRKDTVLKVTKGEEQKYQQLLSRVERDQAELLKRLAKIEEEILIQKNFVSYFQAGEIPKPGTKIFAWPEDNARLTQGFGMTRYAQRGAYGGQGHNGIDITSGIASPIKAAAGGKIVAKGLESCQNYVRPSCNGYWGNWVAIQHPGGLVTLYSHMSKPSTKVLGEEVGVGEVIGYEGATGNVTGPHLHFSVFTEFFTYKDPKTGELRISYNYAKTLNPLDYL